MPGGMFHDYGLFFKQYVRHFKTTGSILPSSPILASSLARYVGPQKNADSAKGSGPRQILEVGPGTGAVTRTICKRLRADDRLYMIELNDNFVAHLGKRFREEPSFRAAADRCEVIHGRLEDLPQDRRYDLIISGLPLNNFTVDSVENILGIYQKLLKPGGTLSFFEYIAIRTVRAVVSNKSERQRLRGIGQALHGVLHHQEIRRDWVWPNVPPAWVHHVRFEPAEGDAAR